MTTYLGEMFFGENPDGGIHCGYNDETDFGDYKATYTLDSENTQKMRAALEQSHTGTLKQMMISEFGKHLFGFEEWCDAHDIRYERFVWIN